jgi:hypothetical protein
MKNENRKKKALNWKNWAINFKIWILNKKLINKLKNPSDKPIPIL